MLQSHRRRVNYLLLFTERARKSSKLLLGLLLSLGETEKIKKKFKTTSLEEQECFLLLLHFLNRRKFETSRGKEFY